jgi:hypothetical protein
MNSTSLRSLAGRYDNTIPSVFLAPIDCLKIPSPSWNFWTGYGGKILSWNYCKQEPCLESSRPCPTKCYFLKQESTLHPLPTDAILFACGKCVVNVLSFPHTQHMKMTFLKSLTPLHETDAYKNNSITELISHKESISWNRGPGSLKV